MSEVNLTPHPEPIHTSASTIRRRQMLLDFLRECDADPPACPVCRYNLKGLTRPFCPECGQELKLTVGAAHLRIGWLFAAVAPGFFSGICATFVLIPIFGRMFFGDGKIMPIPIAMDVFGWCSGIFALMLAFRSRWRIRFLSLTAARQRWIAIGIWLIHIGTLGMFILIAYLFF